MTLTTNFQLSFNPVWSMVDLNGIQANSSFYMWVLSNTVPYNPAPVYEDPAGTIPWGDPIQFLANGTLPVNIYWDNTMTYRLEIRQNLGLAPPSQSDPLIYLVENYVPNNSASGTPIGEDVATDNQLSNGQFANINTPAGFVLISATNPASIEIGPGWFLDLTGTGNVTITRESLNTALPTPTNAPYAIHITLTGGWTGQPVLRQRLQQNGHNWMGKYVAGSMTAMVASGTASLVVRLDASNGQPLGIVQTPFVTNAFAEYTGNVLIPPFVNLDFPPDAYIDYKVLLPPTVEIYLTSMQLTVSSVASNFGYEQIAVDRQIDHLFHYYQSKLEYKPIPSYLVGWDFPLNPAQILGAGTSGSPIGTFASGANTANYFWDQTIIYQTVTSGVSGFRAANGGLTLTAAADGQIGVIQYLGPIAARKILSDRASVRMSISGATASPVSGNVTLWATTDTNLPTLTAAFVTTVSVSGIPLTFNSANWVEIPNVFQNTSFTVPVASATNDESNDIVLNGWNQAGAVPVNTATYFAIFIGFSEWATADTITLNSISLNPGSIPTRPAPKTAAETLIDCQTFFWSTFLPGTVPAQNAGVGTGHVIWQAAGGNTVESQYWVDYPTTMRTIATVTTYNPAAANAQIRDISATADYATTTVFYNTVKSFGVSGVAGGGSAGDRLGIHLSADARLGVVN